MRFCVRGERLGCVCGMSGQVISGTGTLGLKMERVC